MKKLIPALTAIFTAAAPMQSAAYSEGSYFNVYCHNGVSGEPIEFMFSYNFSNHRGSFSMNQQEFDQFLAPIVEYTGEVRERYGLQYQDAILRTPTKDIEVEITDWQNGEYISIYLPKDDFHTLLMQDDQDYWGLSPLGWHCSTEIPEYSFTP